MCSPHMCEQAGLNRWRELGAGILNATGGPSSLPGLPKPSGAWTPGATAHGVDGLKMGRSAAGTLEGDGHLHRVQEETGEQKPGNEKSEDGGGQAKARPKQKAKAKPKEAASESAGAQNN